MEQIIAAVTLFVALLVSLTQGITISNTGAGKVYKLDVVGDVTVQSPTINFNKDEFLILAKHPGKPNKRALLKFEDIPVDKCPYHKIKWAKMYAYFAKAYKPKSHHPVNDPEIIRYLDVHVMKKTWNEGQATTKYRVTGTPWSTQGVGLDGSDAEPCAQCGIVTIFPERPEGFVEFDITSAMLNWSKGIPNNGLVMHAINELEAGRDLRFVSNADKDKTKHAFVNVLCT